MLLSQDVDLGRELKDRAGAPALDELGDGRGVGDVALDELGAVLQGGREVLAAAGRKVVEDDDLLAPFDQGVDQVGSDEARSACDQRWHGGPIYSLALP